jgi:hypothetical protein
VGGFGIVRLLHPSQEQLAAIDERWPAQRAEADWSRSWLWTDLARDKAEVFAVSDDRHRLLSIWCSNKSKPIRLQGTGYYRPDYLEVAPDARGKTMGAFTFSLMAARALELGASGIVLGTWPFLREFYAGLGGIERLPRGGTCRATWYRLSLISRR